MPSQMPPTAPTSSTRKTKHPSLPRQYVPYSHPKQWARFCDHITSSKLQDQHTPATFWKTEENAFRASMKTFPERIRLIQRMNTTSIGNIAAIATRCRFKSIQRLYLQSFRRILATLFVMVEMIHHGSVSSRLLGHYTYLKGGPIQTLLQLKPIQTIVQSRRNRQSRTSVTSKPTASPSPSPAIPSRLKKRCQKAEVWKSREAGGAQNEARVHRESEGWSDQEPAASVTGGVEGGAEGAVQLAGGELKQEVFGGGK